MKKTAAAKSRVAVEEARISPELFKEELDNGNNMVAEFGSKVLVCAFEDGIAHNSFHTSRDTLSVTGKQLVTLRKRTSTVMHQNDSQVTAGQDQQSFTLTPQITGDIDPEKRAMLQRSKSPTNFHDQHSGNHSGSHSASNARKIKKFGSSHNTSRFQFPLKLQIATATQQEGSEYLEVQGEEIVDSSMKFRYELDPKSPMNKLKPLKFRSNPLNEHKGYVRKMRHDAQLAPMQTKQINFNQTAVPETPQPMSQLVTNNFPQRSIKRNSMVKVLNQTEDLLTSSQQTKVVTANNPRRYTISPTTEPFHTNPNSTDKLPTPQETFSTAKNSEQHIQPSFINVKQAVPAFVGSRGNLSPTSAGKGASPQSRARTSPFFAQGLQHPVVEGQNIPQASNRQNNVTITENDKYNTLKNVDSMLEGSIASADTFYMLTANFASANKINANRKTVALDRIEIANFTYPCKGDEKLAEEIAQVDVEHILLAQQPSKNEAPVLQQLQSYVYNHPPPAVQKRVIIEQPGMTVDRDRRQPYRGHQRVIATQTNGPPQSGDRECIKSPASQSNVPQDHLRHTFINSRSKEDKAKTGSGNKPIDMAGSGTEDNEHTKYGEKKQKIKLMADEVVTNTFQRKNQSVKNSIQKDIVPRTISAVMKEADLEVKIPQPTSPYRIGSYEELTERQSTQLQDPNDRDSIVDRGSPRNDPCGNPITIATLPTDGSQPEHIHPIIEKREQEHSKYTLKPVSGSSTERSIRHSKALPSIMNIAAEVQDSVRSPRKKSNRTFLNSTAPGSVLKQQLRQKNGYDDRIVDRISMQKKLQLLQTNSIYTQDRNRCKYLFTNLRRLALINDPISRLSERQKQQLPEDKSFMATQKNCLPSKFKTRNNKHFYDTTIEAQFSSSFAMPSPGMSSRRWDKGNRRAHSISKRTGDFEDDNKNSLAETLRSSRGLTKNMQNCNSTPRGKTSPHFGEKQQQQKSQLPAVASKFKEWLKDSENRELQLGVQQPVTLDTMVGQYQRKLRQKTKLTRQQKRRIDYFETNASQKQVDHKHGGYITAANRGTLVSQQIPMPELTHIMEFAGPTPHSVDSNQSRGAPTTIVTQTNEGEKRLHSAHFTEQLTISQGQGEILSEVRSSVGGIPSHLMSYLKAGSSKGSRGETPRQQTCQLSRNLRTNLPKANRSLVSGSKEQRIQPGMRLNIAVMTSDSPMTQELGANNASGLKSRATRGRNESQESDLTSIAAGKALLGVSEDLSAHNAEFTDEKKTPDGEKMDWPESPSRDRAGSHFGELMDNTKRSGIKRISMQTSSVTGREEKTMRAMTQQRGHKATVLSKKRGNQSRLQTQQESSQPSVSHSIEPIPDQNLLNIHDINTLKRVKVEDDQRQSLLFQLMTLYSSQVRQWQKYDEDWAFFELDHLKHQAPIPPSTQFLLVHLLQREKHRLKRLDKQQQQQEQLLDNSIDSILDSSFEDPVAVLDGSQIREPSIITVEQIPLALLEEIYKEARMRLQMCQSSLLFKFNDDKKMIFSVLKTELEETYGRLKQTASFISM